MKSNFRNSMLTILLTLSAILLSSCEASLAPSSSSMTVTPSSLDVSGGVSGDTTFAIFVVELLSDKASPIPDIDVQITSSLLRVLDADGVLQEAGTSVTIPTNENGLVYVTVEVPLATDFEDTLQVTSGAVSAGAITVAGSSSSSGT